MAQQLFIWLWEWSLAFFVLLSTLLTIILVTLPSRYDPFWPDLVTLSDFSDEDKKDSDSGYQALHATDRVLGGGKCKPVTSVVIVVLGDIGRSPRMQYHATSIAKLGGKVDIVGYHDSEVLPEIQRSKLINVVPLARLPACLRSNNKLLFVLLAPLKVLFQAWAVYYALGYKTKAKRYMLVQNPPSIPTLLIARVVCSIRNTTLIIDWHNLGHTILGLKLGQKHPLVKLSEIYEKFIAGFANSHIAVSAAMVELLEKDYGIGAMTLHDRPAAQFRPLSPEQRRDFRAGFAPTAKHVRQLESYQQRLLVSSTSWTADEDFSVLLDALEAYSATAAMEPRYPKLIVVITGKGPQKDHYIRQIARLEKQHKLVNVKIHTEWLSMSDYALLLGSADLGISLHQSSSGVDLPMKVVDMFGAGLPVVGWNDFKAWPELVQEGLNGRGFRTAAGLEALLEELMGGNGITLGQLREGALTESERRWEHEWPKVANMFGIRLPQPAK